MERWNRKNFSSFDVLLGLGVLAVVAAGLPWLGQQLDMAKNARSRDHASRVAQAILDYHADMGQWPAADGQPMDLAVLTAVPPPTHTLGTMAAPDTRPWIEDLPVDSWGRPFVAAVYGGDGHSVGTPNVSTDTRPTDGARAYPMAPPPGMTVVVVSSGRDGLLQTELAALAAASLPVFRGDDTGQVLHGHGVDNSAN